MIWVIGSKGMLGSEVVVQLDAVSLEYSATDMDVDITSSQSLDEYAKSLFQNEDSNRWIINCSAYTAVDRAEDEPELAARINTEGVKNIAECAAAFNARLIHISTDYVFKGNSKVPLTEDSLTGPTSVYGKTKLAGEHAMAKICSDHFIIRTAWLYGFRGSNFVYAMLKLFNNRDHLTVVNDQHGSPTNASDLSKFIIEIIRQRSINYGVYHYSNEGNITWFDFAEEIYRLGRDSGLVTSNCDIRPCTSAQFPTKANRPEYSLLSKEKVKKIFNIDVPDWKNSLSNFINKIEEIK